MNSVLHSLPPPGAWKKFHTNRTFGISLITLLMFFFGLGNLNAQITWLDFNKQTAPDRHPFDGYGHSVSMAETFALVGAPFADVEIDGNTYSEAGKVYLYKFNGTTWEFSEEILPPNPQKSGNFGFSVSAFQDRAAIGQPNAPGLGSAYVFWIEDGLHSYCEDEFFASQQIENSQYGHAVDISNRWLIVGEPFTPNDQGRAHIYRFEEIAADCPIAAYTSYTIEGNEDMQFGFSVGISVGAPNPYGIASAAIGAPKYESYRGEAFILELDDLSNNTVLNDLLAISQLQAPTYNIPISGDLNEGARFGHSVSVIDYIGDPQISQGDYIGIGAPGLWKTGTQDAHGGAFVALYGSNTDQWVALAPESNAGNGFTNAVQPENLTKDAAFGTSVHYSATYLYVGAPSQALTADNLDPDHNVLDGGAVYAYQRLLQADNGVFQLDALDRQIGDAFGFSVGAYDTELMGGAPKEDHDGSATQGIPDIDFMEDAGAAYWFAADNGQGTCNVVWEWSMAPENLSVECDNVPDQEVYGIEAFNDGVALDVVFNETIISSTCPNSYVLEWIWRAYCPNNQTEQLSMLVEVTDNTAPEFINFQAILEVDCNADIPLAQAVDNCGAVSLTFEDVIFSGGVCGSIQRTYTATDDCSNVSTAVQIINITDNEAPVFEAHEIQVNVTCLAEINILTATDNCDSDVQVTYTDLLFSGGGLCGVVERSYTAIDECGNMGYAIQYINVTDNEGPVFDPYPVEISAVCGDPIIPPGVTDNCGVADLTWTALWFSGGCAGVLEVTYVATDQCGHTSYAQQFIQLIDEVPPVLNGVPEDITVTNMADVPAAATVTATEACVTDLVVEFIEVVLTGYCPQNTTIVRTWVADDYCHEVIATQTITVEECESVNCTESGQGFIHTSQGIAPGNYDNELCDPNEGKDWYYDVQSTSDGNFLGIGFTANNSNNRPYLVKFDDAGNEIWNSTAVEFAGSLNTGIETSTNYAAVGPAYQIFEYDKSTGSYNVIDMDVSSVVFPSNLPVNPKPALTDIKALESGGVVTDYVVSGRLGKNPAGWNQYQYGFLFKYNIASGSISEYVFFNKNNTAEYMRVRKFIQVNDSDGNPEGFALIGSAHSGDSQNHFSDKEGDVYLLKTDLDLNILFEKTYSEADLQAAVGYADNGNEVRSCTACGSAPTENNYEVGFDVKQVPNWGSDQDGDLILSVALDFIQCFGGSGSPCTQFAPNYFFMDAAFISVNKNNGIPIWATNTKSFEGVDFRLPVELEQDLCGDPNNFRIITAGNNNNNIDHSVHNLVRADQNGNFINEYYETLDLVSASNCIFGLTLSHDGGYVSAGNNTDYSLGCFDQDSYAVSWNCTICEPVTCADVGCGPEQAIAINSYIFFSGDWDSYTVPDNGNGETWFSFTAQAANDVLYVKDPDLNTSIDFVLTVYDENLNALGTGDAYYPNSGVNPSHGEILHVGGLTAGTNYLAKVSYDLVQGIQPAAGFSLSISQRTFNTMPFLNACGAAGDGSENDPRLIDNIGGNCIPGTVQLDDMTGAAYGTNWPLRAYRFRLYNEADQQVYHVLRHHNGGNPVCHNIGSGAAGPDYLHYNNVPVSCEKLRVDVNHWLRVIANGTQLCLGSPTATSGYMFKIEGCQPGAYVANQNQFESEPTTYRGNKIKLEVYPNPANDKITVMIPMDLSFVEIVAIDLLGQPVWSGKIESGQTIDVSQWTPGMYQLAYEGGVKRVVITR